LLAALGLSLLVTAIAASTAIAQGRALVFFNEYCITCRQDAHLISAWAVKARAHYSITGVGFRELPAESRTFARGLGWSFPVIGDPNGRIAAGWHVGTPTIIVLVGRHVRREDYSGWKGAAAASLRAQRKAVSRNMPRNKRGRKTHRKKHTSQLICRRAHRRLVCHKRKKHPTAGYHYTPPAITPHPIFVSNFAWRSQLGQDRYVLIRYLRLDSESSAQDAEFAQGAQGSAPGIIGLPVVCGSPGEIEPLLVKAGISAPVTVDTAPDCQAALNGDLDGITSVGPERLFRSDGAPLASSLVVGADFEAYNQAHPSALISAQPWMGNIPVPGNVYGELYSTTGYALGVPIPANLHEVQNLGFIPSHGQVAVRGFWSLCPGCVSSKGDYQLQTWASAHPSAPVVAFTCDSYEGEAAEWAYEHGWTFPVYVYTGPPGSPESFAECFAQLGMSQLGYTWYGDTAYFTDGQRVSDASTSQPLPDYSDMPTL
jgi:hypothetical protein